MRPVSITILIILILLAASSGITKIALLQADVDFFGRYGFSRPVLVTFGAVQLIGGLLMSFRKARFVGALIVAVTFIASLVLLLLDNNIPASILTAIATVLLGLVMRQSRNAARNTVADQAEVDR